MVKQSSMYSLYIDVNSITKVRTVSNAIDVDLDAAEQNTKDGFNFTTRDLQCIQQISKESNLFNQLVNSLCPSIFGHEIVKGKIIFETDKKESRIDPPWVSI